MKEIDLVQPDSEVLIGILANSDSDPGGTVGGAAHVYKSGYDLTDSI